MVSLKKEDRIAGGSVPDDVDAVVTAAKFAFFDYNGTVPIPVVAAIITFTLEDGTESEQAYSAGSSKDFEPSKDGRTILKKPTSKLKGNGITDGKLAQFLDALEAAGFPSDKFDDNIDFLVGTGGHLAAIAGKAFKDKQSGESKGGKPTAVFATITKFPWDKDTAKPGKGSKPAGKTAAAAAPSGPSAVEEKAVKVISAAIIGAGGELDRSSLSTSVFTKLKGDDDRKAIMVLIADDDWIAAQSAWKFAGDSLTIE